MEFMPSSAPLVVLMFLGTGFCLAIAGVAFLYGLARGRRRLARYALLAAATIGGTYAGLVLVFSLASHERVLRAGELKYFCEIDCHVAYSVLDVKTAKMLGAPPVEITAAGNFYVVTVKTWFDERTISTRRGDAPLTPNPRTVLVVDSAGHIYEPSVDAQAVLARADAPSAPLTQPLRPGESYTTVLVFDLPERVPEPRLLITNADAVTRLLIGHEESPFHKKIYFALEPPAKAAAKVPPPSHSWF